MIQSRIHNGVAVSNCSGSDSRNDDNVGDAREVEDTTNECDNGEKCENPIDRAPTVKVRGGSKYSLPITH